MNQQDHTFTQQFCEQSFIDLCTWLSDDKSHFAEHLSRLLDEEHYLKLIELANTYWLTGHLTHQLKKYHVWQKLPGELRDYLSNFESCYLQRSEAIKQEIISVCSLLTKVTPQLILLKGGASLFNGVANPISTRYMADIDILVPQDKLDSCLETLVENGYILDVTESSIATEDFHHAPPAIRKGGPCYIELHRSPLVNSFKSILSAEQAINSATELPLTTELLVQQMHPTHQIIHTIAHSELQDQGYAEAHIDLRQLLNFYLIAKTFAEQICWASVEQKFAETEQSHILRAMCYHANKLLGLAINISPFEHHPSQLQYQKCIQNFTKGETKQSILSTISRVLKGYSTATIINLYGDKGRFAVFRGRLKHLKRHLLMLFKGKNNN